MGWVAAAYEGGKAIYNAVASDDEDSFAVDYAGAGTAGEKPRQPRDNPFGAEDRAYLTRERDAVGARTAPVAGAARSTTGRIDRTYEQEARAKQMAAASRLEDASMGRGPSIANAQFQQGLEASLKAQQAGAVTNASRSNAALAMRGYADGAAAQQQGAALQSAQIKAQEAQAAQAQYGQLMAAMRGQDQAVANQQATLIQQTNLANAGFQQQSGLANQQAALAQTGMNDAQQRAWQQMSMGGSEADRQAWLQQWQMEHGYSVEQQKLDSARRAQNMALIGQGFQAAGALASKASDERAKTDVRPGDDKIRQYLETIGAHDYEYKDEKHGVGRFVSPMAQELEKTEIGKSAVSTDKDGTKMVDYARLLGAGVAADAHLHKRLEKLEKAFSDGGAKAKK